MSGNTLEALSSRGAIITSLTSCATTKHNSQSLSEALATSVADYVCVKQRRIKSNNDGSDASSSFIKNENATITDVVTEMAELTPRLISGEEGENNLMILPPASDGGERIISDSTVSNRDSPDSMDASTSPTTARTTYNRSSMSDDIADLANGMCNFFGSGKSGNNCGDSAPIISGTAAEVLALQHSASAIISCNSVVQCSTSCSTSSSSRRQQYTAEQRKMMIAAAASVITANNNAASNVSPLKHTTTTAADGSPIIDGTDSAKAISIGGGNCDGHHGPDESNFLTVTPEDHQCPSITHEFYSLGCSSHVKSSTTTTATGSSSLGGMDILAEITCHAPPLPLPPNTVSHHTTTTTTTNIHSYNQQQQQHAIPSYQEILSEEQQQNSYHVRQALQHDLFKDEKRVLAIPSYREIYREMGLSPGERHTHDLNCDSYSTIEEMQQVDPNNHSYFYDSSYNNNPYNQSHNQYYINSDDPTRMICRTPTAHFGHVNRDDIDEGKELYSRKDVALLGGHVSEVKDVIGSMKDGCSSLVLGNMEKDLRECDGLLWFLYSTDRANGGGALFRSYHNKLPIRIFRSSLLGGKYAPPFLDVEDDLEEDSDVAYRYDGLYMVRAVWDIHGQETETYPVTGENGWQTYFCTRLPRRPLEEEKREEGMEYNAMGCQELWSTIQKMRGVRKPKKFDIPPPPVKLGPLRKCAISGAYKDRKAVGFVKPTGETQLFVAPPRQRRPKSKSPRAIPTEENDEDDDDNESKSNIVCLQQQQQQHQTNQLSASSSLKVMTQRPRLNSTMSFESNNASPSPRHVDAESDDSESSSSASQIISNQNKRRKTSPNPKYSKDNAVYISKRTTAAKAEAANMVMFGGSKCLKRNSSDSVNYTVSATKGRCAVDESIITDGSRILVAHKGALYKATIRRRREKDGRHDFLIHYDGNKKSNTHWIGVDDIHKILEINVDTPPKKHNFTASGGVGIKTDVNGKDKRSVGKRKSPVPTEEIDSDNNKKNPQCVLPDNKSIPAVDDSELDCEVVTISPINAVATRKPRETVVSHVCKVNSPRKKSLVKSIADVRGTIDSDNDDGSESDDEGNAKAKSKPIIPSKYPVGDHVYVEYRQIFYSSTILNIRRKRGGAGGSNIEYLVHYEGYKKSSNTWVKEATLHEVSAKTTKRFEAQRITPADPADKLPESEQHQSSESCNAPRKRKGLVVDTESTSLDNQPAMQKKPPTPKLRSDESDSVLKSIKSGVDFLVGSMVFVEWTGALFLAKMLKKRYSGDHAEYLISYDGYNSNHDAWVSIHKIYEVNPQTKRVYKKLTIDMSLDGGKQKKPNPLPERRETRKKAQYDDGAAREDEANIQSPSHISSRATAKVARAVSSLSSDMKGIDSGVEFLPGSTIFAEYKGGLCLAKMMKKRGKGAYTEYLVEYNGLTKSVEAWVSTALIYEINPQTKRMFRELSVTK